MTTESQNQAWSAYLGIGLTLRDCFAMTASEADIDEHLRGPEVHRVEEDLIGRKRDVFERPRRTREQARYAFADAMMKQRETT